MLIYLINLHTSYMIHIVIYLHVYVNTSCTYIISLTRYLTVWIYAYYICARRIIQTVKYLVKLIGTYYSLKCNKYFANVCIII